MVRTAFMLWLVCFLKMLENHAAKNIDPSDSVEDVIPAIFPKLFFPYEQNYTKMRGHISNSFNDVLHNNKGKNFSNNFVKGYSLRLPINKFENGAFNENPNQEGRQKRGVVHLYNIVNCATGCNALKYKGYGCYCGFLGSGYPVDGIDMCCKKHDWCYHAANCPMYLEYFVPYFWKCWYNRPFCAIDHGEFGGPGSCADKLCECDRELSECLRRFPCPVKRAFCKSSPLRLFQNAFMLFT